MIKLNLITAVSANMGIGKNNDLPWKLKNEMQYFTNMTTKTNDNLKKNVVIMGRKNWDSIPTKYKPLSNRFNFVLTRSKLDLRTFEGTYCFNSLEEILVKLNEPEFVEKYETVWVIGGSQIYEESMRCRNFFRLYLTEIKMDFDCDTFFPKILLPLKKVENVPGVPSGIQEEHGILYEFKVFENLSFGK